MPPRRISILSSKDPLMGAPRFQGVIPPLVTPLDDQQQVDFSGLERLVERLIVGGVQGLFVVGTTGEGPSLTQSAQQQIVSAVCDQASGRLPVLVGITNTVFAHSLEIAEAAYAAGSSAVVLAPPYYLPLTQSELIGYTLRLVDRLPLPVMLYNMPGCCKTWFDVETVLRLSEVPEVLGLKDSSGDLDYLQRAIAAVSQRPDFAFFVGPEEILVEAMRLGAHGGVHGGANVFPRLYVAMYHAAAAGDWDEAERIQKLVLEFGTAIYSASEGPSRIIKGIKTALDLLGVCQDQMAEPLTRHLPEARKQIQKHLQQLQSQLGPLAKASLDDSPAK
jgi:4-hydroxy-tetrahydrodipicolinate synthase